MLRPPNTISRIFVMFPGFIDFCSIAKRGASFVLVRYDQIQQTSTWSLNMLGQFCRSTDQVIVVHQRCFFPTGNKILSKHENSRGSVILRPIT